MTLTVVPLFMEGEAEIQPALSGSPPAGPGSLGWGSWEPGGVLLVPVGFQVMEVTDDIERSVPLEDFIT